MKQLDLKAMLKQQSETDREIFYRSDKLTDEQKRILLKVVAELQDTESGVSVGGYFSTDLDDFEVGVQIRVRKK